MTRTVLVFGLVLTMGAGLAAQQQVPDEPDIARILFQVKIFEKALVNAVESGARDVARKAAELYPGAEVAWYSDPVVRGWRQPSFGYMFEVEVPTILPVSVYVLRQQAPLDRAVPVRPLPGPGAGQTLPAKPVNETNVLPVPEPAAKPTAGNFDPIQFYSDQVRAALIDTLIEGSRGLPVKEGEWVSVNAAPAALPVPNPLDPRQRMLILQVLSSDLAKYHRGDVSRDQVLTLIREARF